MGGVYLTERVMVLQSKRMIKALFSYLVESPHPHPQYCAAPQTVRPSGAGTWFADIESREVLENEDGPELRFDLLPHLNRLVHGRLGLDGPELPSETFLSESDTSVLAGSDG